VPDLRGAGRLTTRESPIGAEALPSPEESPTAIPVGVDAHENLHVTVALDDVGRELARWQGTHSH
jgi:hypothetical protein